ncbi:MULTISPECIES: tRNA preQ1(34) S-adenosylmethionine ribosyltransferase-isomerase QueA [Halocynthiibacter]|uniref:S-adenosylmethionine:tRNA ribosyltransferase-isomerase n=1 Tax=Halocynthiibacter halioticoli TaxID=2986804 RepID=A0AAE3IXM6_9RHOB|nr:MULTISPECIES: tRNA preQ1(34) S-adenosylmethionine ribosyltransferase-isomerase QueA [Halocynthiibacter]MCV6824137.1 tRNA preQ1(34) S-adenosylmethionine ribosyltransferase-isomerase QueA [Halocynthiibacter halioticoli]MCW4057138.1 tRNA preQ1(34) S-adenosylmethionine ribosyltransferase-isomerase QueA [Halocynthiibacter sp. SDUM655004]
MKLSDFDFDLPEDLIATRPVSPREAARLLVSDGTAIEDLHVADLLGQFREGDRLVLNDTKVIPARLFGVRRRDSAQGPTEARIEVTLLAPEADGSWSALIKPLKKLREGETVEFSAGLTAELVAKDAGQGRIKFNLTGDDFDAALAEAGAMPLPPYIAAKRPADAQDKEDYQTVFARRKGAVAAPTASLHLTREMLEALENKGVDITYVTLHVGAGTFLPVKVDDISEHRMHAEWGEVSEAAAADIRDTKAKGGRVIPVGTTALRLIETAAREGEIAPWVGPTDIFITPGFEFKVADGLMTNFHLPKSTLMMLVSAFIGTEHTKEIYDHAIETRYRFFSYGDSSLLWRNG